MKQEFTELAAVMDSGVDTTWSGKNEPDRKKKKEKKKSSKGGSNAAQRMLTALKHINEEKLCLPFCSETKFQEKSRLVYESMQD